MIADVALELPDTARGHSAALHPTDAAPAALRLTVIAATQPLIRALDGLAPAFRGQAVVIPAPDSPPPR